MRNTRRVAIYIRVSTTEQKVDGYSLEAQEKKLRDHITNNSALEIDTKSIKVFCDTHTGSDFNRPQLQKLLTKVKEGKFDAVMVWKIDRLSRSLKHLLDLFEIFQNNNCSLISVQENIDFRGPIGSLIFQIFGAIAQFERELIKGRTKMGKIASAEQGNWTLSQVPYGYKKIKNKSGKGSKLETIEAEAETIRQIFNWSIYSGYGFLKISNELNNLKIPRGEAYLERYKDKPWDEKAVRVILDNETYTGECVVNDLDDNGEELPEQQKTIIHVPAIISSLTYQQEKHIRRNRKGGRANNLYMLSGKLIDITLDNPKKFTGAKRSKGGFSYRRKQFKDSIGQHFPVFEIPAKAVDDYVWGKIKLAMNNPEVFIQTYFAKQDQGNTIIANLEKRRSALQEEIATLEGITVPQIEAAYETNLYSLEKTQAKLTKANTKIEKLTTELESITDELKIKGTAALEISKLKDAAEIVKYNLDNLSLEHKKILCDLFVNRIEMSRTKPESKWIIDAKVVFNFNPNKFVPSKGMGRTQNSDNNKVNAISESNNIGNGD